MLVHQIAMQQAPMGSTESGTSPVHIELCWFIISLPPAKVALNKFHLVRFELLAFHVFSPGQISSRRHALLEIFFFANRVRYVPTNTRKFYMQSNSSVKEPSQYSPLAAAGKLGILYIQTGIQLKVVYG
jgi:hypothetical protein